MSHHRTGCAALRYTSAGNSRSLENSRSSSRRDSAWRAHVHGTRVLPMDDGRGFFARLFGPGR